MAKHTIVLNGESDFCDEAKKTLLEGGLVAFPTETVYGLGANALDEEACKKIYLAKGRPQDNPLIVHIGEVEQLKLLTKRVSDKAKKLIEKFWPGPLTLIFEKSKIVPYGVTGGLETVAIRMPSHKVALKLLRGTGVPIAAPSANLSGKPSPTSANHVLDDLSGVIDMVIDAGDVDIGIESTILDTSCSEVKVLRPGHITKEMLEEEIGAIEEHYHNENEAPKAPGMKYKHYAPKGSLRIIEGDFDDFCAYLNIEFTKGVECAVCILTTDEYVEKLKGKFLGVTVLSYGSGDVDEAAKRLYSLLRTCDDLDVELIYSVSFSNEGKGYALMNRLSKAAESKLIKLGGKDEKR